MTDLIKNAVEHAKKDEFYEVLELAKKMDPFEYSEFFAIIGNFKENPDYLDKMGAALNYEDMHGFFELGSSKRRARFLMDKAEKEELSDEEMIALRGAVL